MKFDDQNRDWVGLLLYLETRAVEYNGRVNISHMNSSDLQTAKDWSKAGFIRFGRITAFYSNENGSHWVELTEESWKQALHLRQIRGMRGWAKKEYTTTQEQLEIDDECREERTD